MELQQKIVEVALALFYQQGFHATGVEQIREAAGVSKKTLYKYFASKDDLMLAVLRLRHDEFMAKLHCFIEPYPLTARPQAYLQFIEAWSQEPTFNGCLFINVAAEYAQRSSPMFQLAQSHKQAVLSAVQRFCLEAGMPAAAQHADELFVLGEGLIVNYKFGLPTRVACLSVHG